MRAIIAILCVGLGLATTAQNTLPSSGNVGIGTTAPSKQLEVNGESRFNGTVTADSSVIVKDSLVVDKDGRVKGKLTVDDKAVMKDDADVEKDLKVAGNVTVSGETHLVGDTRIDGDTKFTSDVKIEGAVRTEGLLKVEDQMRIIPFADGVDGILTSSGNGTVQKRGMADIAMGLYTGPACLQTVGGGYFSTWSSIPGPGHGIIYTGVPCPGWVGIGTDDPKANLHVVDNTIVGNWLSVGSETPVLGYNFSLTGSGFVNERFNIASQPSGNSIFENAPLFVGTLSGSPYSLAVSGQSLLTGATVIGTWNSSNSTTSLFTINNTNNSPAFTVLQGGQKTLQLESSGLLRARHIKVDQNSWADFVFAPDYSLMSLDSLEAFIDSNSHLPGVPTTAQVQQEGVDLGDMNKVLLQKVEELTLYIIELKGKLESQEQRILELETSK